MSKTPVEEKHIEFKEKRSEFIGIVQPCENQQDMTEELKRLKKKYHDSSHICWAFRIHNVDGLEELYSDAGEPAGSAGLPMLNALRNQDMVNALVIVIRYYGGTKLGKRGLMDAYGGAATEAVKQVKTRPYEHRERYLLDCPLDYYGEVQRALSAAGGQILVDRSQDRILWETQLPSRSVSRLINELRDITRGAAVLKNEERT